MAESNDAEQKWVVPTTRLDDVPVRGERILLKLDLQGAELRAFSGAEKLLGRCAAVLCEVSLGEHGTYEPIREFLGARGFREAGTFNELQENGTVLEGDKLWVRIGGNEKR
jgi:hypothetical protein